MQARARLDVTLTCTDLNSLFPKCTYLTEMVTEQTHSWNQASVRSFRIVSECACPESQTFPGPLGMQALAVA